MSGFRALALSLLAVVATAYAGEEALRHDLSGAPKWKAGDVVTRSARSKLDATISLKVRGRAPVDDREHSRSFEAAWVQRCEEADASGVPQRMLIHLSTWIADSDDVVDRCIEGAFVEVGPRGWVLVGVEENPTPQARRWLDEHFGSLASASRAGPGGPLEGRSASVGETWEWDGRAAVLDAVGTVSPELVPASVPLSCKLENADASDDATVVHVTGAGECALAAPAAGSKDPAPAKGSTLRARVDLTGDPARPQRGFTSVVGVDVVARFATPTTWVETKLAEERTEDWASGGEMPALPERDPAAGPDVVLARRSSWSVGDSFVESGRDTWRTTVVPVDAEGVESAPTRLEESVEWRAVVRCTEAGAGGEPTAVRVRVVSWKRTAGATEDTSLAGAEVDVGPDGWRMAAGGAEPNEHARRWLDRQWGQGVADDPSRAAARPAMRAAAGQSWIVSADEIVGPVRAWTGMPIDSADARSLATLEAVRGAPGDETAEITWSCDAPVRCVAGCDCTNAEILRGGRIHVSGRATGPAGSWDRAGSTTETAELSISVPGEGDGLRRVTFAVERSRLREAFAPPTE